MPSDKKIDYLFFNKLLIGLIFFEIFLAVLSLGNSLLGFNLTIINVNDEANIPTWFSSIQLFVISSLFFVLRNNRDYAPELSARLLFFLAAGFMFLSLDETAQIHEGISKTFISVPGFPRFSQNHGLWILPYVVLLFIFTLTFYRELWQFAYCYRRSFTFVAVGSFIFVLGGLVFEVISYQFMTPAEDQLIYICEVTIEEFLEMSGASLILYGVLLLFLPENQA